jgi:hypothetical protein
MILPLLKTKFYKKSLVFLIALAIGTLVGDSMFYLLPRVGLKGFVLPISVGDYIDSRLQ